MAISLQHIHLLSPDKHALGKWYCDHLDFEILDDLETLGEPNGPLLMTSDRGKTGVSIFNTRTPVKNILPAFGTDPTDFIRLHAQWNHPRIYDHYRFLSFYVSDGDGNRIELCCTEDRALRAELQIRNTPVFPMTPETYTA